MTRLLIVVAHLMAVPAALVLSLGLALVVPTTLTGQAVQVGVHDTYFVVAHFHGSLVLGSTITVVTVLSYWCRSWNRGLVAAWVLLVAHAVAAMALWRAHGGLSSGGAGIFSILPPLYPGLAYSYIGSFVAGVGVTLVALLWSLAKGLRSRVDQVA
jgi:heme/copper-type cytochrome/quinol oxidase subunit 1